MISEFKHTTYNGWDFNNLRAKPVLCASKCYSLSINNIDYQKLENQIRKYLSSKLNNYIVDVNYSDYYRKTRYKPENTYVIIDVVFKTDTDKSKIMFNKYIDIFDKIDEMIYGKVKEKETKIC